jgi:ABC-type multidrug transport system ATPase subunit
VKLECDGVEFSYSDKPLLKSIYMRIDTGAITGLLGRNGSGKSTLMKVCFGALRPWTSSVRIDDRLISFPAFTSRRIAYLPQDSFLPSGMSLRKILRCYSVNDNELLRDFPEFDLQLDLFPGELSGGYLRLFEVLLILKKPGVNFCLLDEPFTGLSPAIIERLQMILQNEKAKKGIVVSDHLYRQVKEIADSMIMLTNGRTVVVKDEEDLVKNGYLNFKI